MPAPARQFDILLSSDQSEESRVPRQIFNLPPRLKHYKSLRMMALAAGAAAACVPSGIVGGVVGGVAGGVTGGIVGAATDNKELGKQVLVCKDGIVPRIASSNEMERRLAP